MSDDEALDLSAIFTEPPRPPTPEPTTATYTRDVSQVSKPDDWRTVDIRLVGAHPLWAHYLWNAALALASYLDAHPDLVRNRCVLELGAGGALPSIVAAKLAARKVVATDYPDASLVENMKYNISQNTTEDESVRVDVQGYVWGHDERPLLAVLPSTSPTTTTSLFDVIILSDLIFNHSQHDALLRTCEAVLAPAPAPAPSTPPDAAANPHPQSLHLQPQSQQSHPHQPHQPNPNAPPQVLVFYSHHRPHLAHRDMQFFEKAARRGWVCEEVYTKTFPPMFPEDPGEEAVRSTVHGWRLTRR